MTYSNFGTTTFPNEPITASPIPCVKIKRVSFENEQIIIRLSDYRAISLTLSQYPWLKWLYRASPEERERWEIVPSGRGVWWEELDEGIELEPLLDMKPLV